MDKKKSNINKIVIMLINFWFVFFIGIFKYLIIELFLMIKRNNGLVKSVINVWLIVFKFFLVFLVWIWVLSIFNFVKLWFV